jgi:hypothetical protein
MFRFSFTRHPATCEGEGRSECRRKNFGKRTFPAACGTLGQYVVNVPQAKRKSSENADHMRTNHESDKIERCTNRVPLIA